MSLDKSLALMVEGTELSLDDETVRTSSEEEIVAVKQGYMCIYGKRIYNSS